MIQKANWNLYKLTVLPKNSLFLYFRDPSLIINSSSFPFPFPFPSPKHFISKTQKNCQFPYIEIKFYTEEQYHKYFSSPLPFPSHPSFHPSKGSSKFKSKSSQTTSNQFLHFIFIFFFIFKKFLSLSIFPSISYFPYTKTHSKFSASHFTNTP